MQITKFDLLIIRIVKQLVLQRSNEGSQAQDLLKMIFFWI